MVQQLPFHHQLQWLSLKTWDSLAWACKPSIHWFLHASYILTAFAWFASFAISANQQSLYQSATIENPFHQRLNILMVEKLSVHQWQWSQRLYGTAWAGLTSPVSAAHCSTLVPPCLTHPHCKLCLLWLLLPHPSLQINNVLHYCIVVQQMDHHSYQCKLSGNVYLQNVFCLLPKLNF